MNTDHLIRMANQIAANLAARGNDVAIGATAEHIAKFWDPRMRAVLLGVDRNKLDPIARAAVERLAAQDA